MKSVARYMNPLLTKHVIAFNSFKSGKICWPETVLYVFFRSTIWLCLNKVNHQYDPLYIAKAYFRSAYFLHVWWIKKSSRTLRTVNLEKCSFCNLFWWYSVVAFPRIDRISRGCRTSKFQFASISKTSSFYFKVKRFARVRWTCKSGEELFKILSRVIYCNFNSWCKSNKMYGEEIHADVLEPHCCSRESNFGL